MWYCRFNRSGREGGSSSEEEEEKVFFMQFYLCLLYLFTVADDESFQPHLKLMKKF